MVVRNSSHIVFSASHYVLEHTHVSKRPCLYMGKYSMALSKWLLLIRWAAESGIALDLRSGDRMVVRDSSHIGFSASRYVIRPRAPEPKHGQTYDGVKEML